MSEHTAQKATQYGILWDTLIISPLGNFGLEKSHNMRRPRLYQSIKMCLSTGKVLNAALKGFRALRPTLCQRKHFECPSQAVLGAMRVHVANNAAITPHNSPQLPRTIVPKGCWGQRGWENGSYKYVFWVHWRALSLHVLLPPLPTFWARHFKLTGLNARPFRRCNCTWAPSEVTLLTPNHTTSTASLSECSQRMSSTTPIHK